MMLPSREELLRYIETLRVSSNVCVTVRVCVCVRSSIHLLCRVVPVNVDVDVGTADVARGSRGCALQHLSQGASGGARYGTGWEPAVVRHGAGAHRLRGSTTQI